MDVLFGKIKICTKCQRVHVALWDISNQKIQTWIGQVLTQSAILENSSLS